MTCFRSIPRKDADGIIFCGRPRFSSRWPNGFEAVPNGIMIRAEVVCRKVRLSYDHFFETLSIGRECTNRIFILFEWWCLSIAMASKQILACHEPKKSHIIYFMTGYRTKNAVNLGERACFYFYHFELIVFMNKRLMLTTIANFASRHFQLHSSLGCVQPCTIYNTASFA